MPATYLRHPSKKNAVLLLVFLSLGLIITWLQGKTRNSNGMRVPNGNGNGGNVAKCTDKKIERTPVLRFNVLLRCIADVLLRVLENNNLSPSINHQKYHHVWNRAEIL
jgi:hypothetical protein